MEIVRGYEDLIKIRANKNMPFVIWGGGQLGRMLLQEIRMNKLSNVYIYDKNVKIVKNMSEYIPFDQIKKDINKIFIIAAEQEKTIYEISQEILCINNKAEIYRYLAKDDIYFNQKLLEGGFWNGSENHTVLDYRDARKLLAEKIKSKEPFMCSRWGSTEGRVVYATVSGLCSDSEIAMLKDYSGFYPLDRELVYKFAECSINAAKTIDILIAGCWCKRIDELYKLYSPQAALVPSCMINPFWSDQSWSYALRGKNVLVIHPFAKLMEEQYEKRNKLFESPDILPEMNLKVYQAVQSLGGSDQFVTWFDALDKMERDISNIDFDVALIGCGAYGMPLGAFIKLQMQKKAIHIGGSLQILFGIKGKRWESKGYDYQHKLYNEYWVRPTENLRPQNYMAVENGCYW